MRTRKRRVEENFQLALKHELANVKMLGREYFIKRMTDHQLQFITGNYDYFKTMLEVDFNEKITVNEFVVIFLLKSFAEPKSLLVGGFAPELPRKLCIVKTILEDYSSFDFADFWCYYIKWKDRVFDEYERMNIEKLKFFYMDYYD